jgi:hypothetical protein
MSARTTARTQWRMKPIEVEGSAVALEPHGGPDRTHREVTENESAQRTRHKTCQLAGRTSRLFWALADDWFPEYQLSAATAALDRTVLTFPSACIGFRQASKSEAEACRTTKLWTLFVGAHHEQINHCPRYGFHVDHDVGCPHGRTGHRHPAQRRFMDLRRCKRSRHP